MKRDYSLAEIAAFLEAELHGDGSVRISGLNTLQNAGAGELAFLANPKYSSQLPDSRAEAVILGSEQAKSFSGNCLILDNPYLGYAKISAWFTTASCQGASIHASAVIRCICIVIVPVVIRHYLLPYYSLIG